MVKKIMVFPLGKLVYGKKRLWSSRWGSWYMVKKDYGLPAGEAGVW